MNNGEEKDYNPFNQGREYDFYDELITSDAKRAMSRTHLGLALISVAANAFIILFQILYSLIFGDEAYLALIENVYFRMLFSTLPLYLIGVPIFVILVQKLPKRKFRDTGMGVGEFLAMIPISWMLMMIGNYIGIILNEMIGVMTGSQIENSTSELISESPLWLIFVLVVVVGPIVEEFIFRKLLIEKLSVYGAWFSITVSAIAFGLFHGNLFQFFYAAFIGFILGFVAVKSGSWLTSALLHAILNFLGGFVSVLIEPNVNRYYEFADRFLAGEAVDPLEYSADITITTIYILLQYALLIAGVVLLIFALRRGRMRLYDKDSTRLPKGRVAKICFGNVGVIVFLVVSFLSILASIFI